MSIYFVRIYKYDHIYVYDMYISLGFGYFSNKQKTQKTTGI